MANGNGPTRLSVLRTWRSGPRSARPYGGAFRTWGRAAALAAASILTLSSAQVQAQTGAPARPNIVVFLADDMGYKDYGRAGDPNVRTPNIDKLVDQGMTFDRAFVASPACAPSRAALLTGLMPSRNGAEANHESPQPTNHMMPDYLRSLGYQVVAFGKVAHYGTTGLYGFDRFEHDRFHDPEAVTSALRWLRNRDDPRPLAIFVGSNWPHVPWPATSEGYTPDKVTLPAHSVDLPITRDARTRYYAAVSRMDKELGSTLALVDRKLGPNTFVLFSADHGAQWPFGKWNLYDAGIRVPMVVRWAGKVAPRSRSNAMVSWVDILPTLVEVGGGKPPLDLDGRSFAAAFDPARAFKGWPEIYTTHNNDQNFNVYPMRSVRTDRWKYIVNLHPDYVYTSHIDLQPRRDAGGYFPAWREAARTDRTARDIVARYYRRPAEELYDLHADPDERRNLAANPRYRAVKEELRLKLSGWRAAQHDDRPHKGTPHREEGPMAGLD